MARSSPSASPRRCSWATTRPNGQILDDSDKPIPGLYGVEAFDESQQSVEMWAAVFRDQANAVTEFRRAAREQGDFGYISEEYRILDSKKNAEMRRLEAELVKARADAKVYGDALSLEQKQHLASRRRLAAAILSEEEALIKWEEEHDRCLELEAREAEFAPGVEALLSGVVDKAAPLFESMFPHVRVQDGNFVAQDGSGAQDPNGAQAQGGQAQAQGGAAQGAQGEELPSDGEVLEILAHLLYFAEGARGFVEGAIPWPYPRPAWSCIRVLIRMVSGEDPGPEPYWPSQEESGSSDASPAEEGSP